jgi:methanogenic corrinoid protein MtbC1
MNVTAINNDPDTPLFNMKAVVTQTCLKPDTIRAWERRYGFPQPKRTVGGHRQYTQRDIDTLKWMIARQEEGISISHAIDLWRSKVNQGEDPIYDRKENSEEKRSVPVLGLEGKQIDQFREAWLDACLSFDRETAERILAQSFALYSPDVVCIEILQKGLRQVGDGWYDGRVTAQQEHFTSALVLQRLETLVSAAPPPTRDERIIVATAPRDYHVFSSLLITYLLRQRGWEVIYLGADVPEDQLELTVEHIDPTLVIISAQLLHTAANLKEIALVLREKGIKVAYGGLIFNTLPLLCEIVPGFFLGKTVEEAVENVAEILSAPASAPGRIEALPINQSVLEQFRERRSLIESHVWAAFVNEDIPTKFLTEINNDLAQTIEGALILGDTNLLQKDIAWIENLLMGYRLTQDLVIQYLDIYHEAAKVHLNNPVDPIVDWLSALVSNN